MVKNLMIEIVTAVALPALLPVGGGGGGGGCGMLTMGQSLTIRTRLAQDQKPAIRLAATGPNPLWGSSQRNYTRSRAYIAIYRPCQAKTNNPASHFDLIRQLRTYCSGKDGLGQVRWTGFVKEIIPNFLLARRRPYLVGYNCQPVAPRHPVLSLPGNSR
jgi:hypothetical protein